MQKNKEKIQLFIFGLLVFGFLVTFFVIIHPMTIFDTDDWAYIYSTRTAIPDWNNWNPTRLFPEIMMALVSQIAAVLIYPISGDYVNALIWGHGVFTSVIILMYVITFVKLIREKYQVTSEVALSYGTLFVVFHFLVFRKYYSGNVHLFYTSNVTCYYYYLLPALLNCIAVMELMRIEKNSSIWKEKTAISKGIFYLLVYLCIFSNLFCSVVLMAYVGEKLLITLCNELRQGKFRLSAYIIGNIEYLMIFVLWIVQQIFEMNGGRADSVSNGNLWLGIVSALKVLWRKVYVLNYWFVGVILAIVLLTIFVIVKNWRKAETQQILCEIGHVVLIQILTITYLILLCGASEPGYIMRCDVLIGPAFFGFLLVFMGIILIVKRFPEMNSIIPLLIFILICETNTMGNTFMDINMGGLSNETCIEIDNDIIEQVKSAVNQGKTSMKLYVPDFESVDNWPIALYGGESISDALSKHGVIRRQIYIEIVPTKEKNEQFHLN